MGIYFVTFAVFVLMILCMSVGVIFTGRRIQGSCGGLGASAINENGDKTCGYCGATFEEQKEKGCGDESGSSSSPTTASSTSSSVSSSGGRQLTC